jgi:signal transduction histidine kinase
MWHSLRLRLLVATILVVVVAVGVTAFVASQRTLGEFQRYIEHGGSQRYHRFAGFFARSYEANGSWTGIQTAVEQIAVISGQRVVVADAQGKIVGDSERSLLGKPVNSSWPLSSSITVDENHVGSLYIDPVGGPDEADLAFLSAVNRSVLIGALIAGLAALVVTLAVSSRILRPIERLTAAAQKMEKGDLTVRVPVDSIDEIGKLAHAFNGMAGSLARQEELRRNMVNDVAHELRTPLTNLRGYLQASRDGLLAPDTALVDNLYEETMLLNRLVADLQELAQAEAGQLTLECQPRALNNLVDQAVGMLRPQAETKGLSLTADVPADLPLVNVDPERVGQVLRNLLNNAMAHTPSGGTVAVMARFCPGENRAEPNLPAVTVSVHDTGTGIPPDHLPFVFERFYRVDRSRARQTGGAGLGLAIVRQLVGAMGGSVSAESELGRGSTFSFTLPVAQHG